MVVYRDDRIFVGLCHGADHIGYPLLHLRIGSLYGIEFYGIGKLTCCNRRDRRASHAYSIIVSPHDDDLITFGRIIFLAVLTSGKSYTASLHDHFIVAMRLVSFFMLKGQYRPRNQRLTKFISKITRSIRSFDQDIHRCLVEPRSWCKVLFPASTSLGTSIRSHVHRSTSQWN